MSRLESIMEEGFERIDRAVTDVCDAYVAPRFDPNFLNNPKVRKQWVEEEARLVPDPRRRKYY